MGGGTCTGGGTTACGAGGGASTGGGTAGGGPAAGGAIGVAVGEVDDVGGVPVVTFGEGDGWLGAGVVLTGGVAGAGAAG